MIDDIGAPHLALVIAVGLTFLGLALAWVSVPRVHGAPRVPARVLIVLGVTALALFGLDVRGLLAIGVVVVAKLSCDDEPLASKVYRPRLTGIAIAAGVTGIVVSMALAGALPLIDRFDQTEVVAAIVFAGVGLLGVLAISDWERVRLRDRVHRDRTDGAADVGLEDVQQPDVRQPDVQQPDVQQPDEDADATQVLAVVEPPAVPTQPGADRQTSPATQGDRQRVSR